MSQFEHELFQLTHAEVLAHMIAQVCNETVMNVPIASDLQVCIDGTVKWNWYMPNMLRDKTKAHGLATAPKGWSMYPDRYESVGPIDDICMMIVLYQHYDTTIPFLQAALKLAVEIQIACD